MLLSKYLATGLSCYQNGVCKFLYRFRLMNAMNQVYQVNCNSKIATVLTTTELSGNGKSIEQATELCGNDMSI